MIVYRLSRSKYAGDLSGKGAEIAGGRWNNKGTPMVYTAANRALCVAEIAVHTPLGLIPVDYTLVTIEVPDELIARLEEGKLDARWFEFPHQDSTQQIGDEFARACLHLALMVPSAVVQGDHNLLINPFHPDIRKARILAQEPIRFDDRLFVRS